MKRGEIWLIDRDPAIGAEIIKTRSGSGSSLRMSVSFHRPDALLRPTGGNHGA